MNKLLIILSSTVFLFLIVQLLTSYRTSGIETPQYKVLSVYDGFEIRQYDSMILAQTVINSNSYKKSASTGFRRVAGYIFGGNAQNKEISMTAPVFMAMGESTKMSFVMPKQYSLSDLPNPNSNNVQLMQIPPKKYAVLGFSGFASDKKIEIRIKKLKTLLEKHQIETKGEYTFLGYNSPWELFGRRNEIAIELY